MSALDITDMSALRYARLLDAATTRHPGLRWLVVDDMASDRGHIADLGPPAVVYLNGYQSVVDAAGALLAGIAELDGATVLPRRDRPGVSVG